MHQDIDEHDVQLCDNSSDGDAWKYHFGDLISDIVVYAHSDNKDTCDGDPGGPLLTNRSDKDDQIGNKNCDERHRVFQNLIHRKINKFTNEKTRWFL